MAIIRILVNGGGHHEFSHEKVDEKNGYSFFLFLGGNICEKTQVFKIYMKKSCICYITPYTKFLLDLFYFSYYFLEELIKYNMF